jgi:NAD(P)H-dependent flavin oxidoreductase YrpB (nitropropane dioxygenase family)
MLSGKEVLPLIEGGKGINITDGKSAGAWAAEGCVGTFSAVTPDYYDSEGKFIFEQFFKKSRQERHQEMIEQSIKGGIAQAQIAHESSNGQGRIHMNMLWEAGGAEEIINNVLEKAKGLIHGITCGAGLPYKLGEIASKFGVYYYPIVSSARAFQILWRRAYSSAKDYLGGVVYEDPWLAGGHNGLSNAENPNEPQSPYERVRELRRILNKLGLQETPIIIAGGVWRLKDWEDYIDNPELGKVAFQFGTRPMVTTESPVSEAWKKLMLTLKKGDVVLQRFSPTGFFSSAIKNSFLEKLINRKEGEVSFKEEKTEDFNTPVEITKNKQVFIKSEDISKINEQKEKGFNVLKITPDDTIVCMNEEDWKKIQTDRKECVGCISRCQFSGWEQNTGNTGKLPDPRSFCIHKTLYDIGHGGKISDALLFAGHQVYNFAKDPLYRNGIVPSVKELIAKIKSGE